MTSLYGGFAARIVAIARELRLPDEAFLPRVAERQAKRHRLTALKSPIARQHGVRHEESTVGIEEHSECRDGANSTSNGHKAKFVAKHGAPHGRIPQSN